MELHQIEFRIECFAMAPKKLEKMPYSFHCGLTGLLFIVLPLVVNAQQQGQRTIKIGK